MKRKLVRFTSIGGETPVYIAPDSVTGLTVSLPLFGSDSPVATVIRYDGTCVVVKESIEKVRATIEAGEEVI